MNADNTSDTFLRFCMADENRPRLQISPSPQEIAEGERPQSLGARDMIITNKINIEGESSDTARYFRLFLIWH
jgi:hypothetical protein